MNKKLKITDEIKKLSFEEALSELEQIVENLERGDIELEDSISIYEKGIPIIGYDNNTVYHFIFNNDYHV